MGFGYGVWLVPKKGLFKTSHTAHATIACFMNKTDAFTLFDEISSKLGTKYKLNIIKKSSIYDKKTYPDEKDLLLAWGYDCYKPNYWDNFYSICNNYKCNFSIFPHISMLYSYDKKDLVPFDCNINSIDVNLCVADIRDDNPDKWKIIN